MKTIFLLITLLSITTYTFGQDVKRSLDFSVYDDWEYIEKRKISNDGNWVLYESNPYYGSGGIVIYNTKNLYG